MLADRELIVGLVSGADSKRTQCLMRTSSVRISKRRPISASVVNTSTHAMLLWLVSAVVGWRRSTLSQWWQKKKKRKKELFLCFLLWARVATVEIFINFISNGTASSSWVEIIVEIYNHVSVPMLQALYVSYNNLTQENKYCLNIPMFFSAWVPVNMGWD